MLKRVGVILVFILLNGCARDVKYTTHSEYVEETKFDQKTGIYKDFEARRTIEWKR